MVRQDIYPARAGAQIQPEVYGNFSEHLGRCIYEGLYVGEDSAIPNVNGMRTDVVEALRNIQLPVLRWPGGPPPCCRARRAGPPPAQRAPALRRAGSPARGPGA